MSFGPNNSQPSDALKFGTSGLRGLVNAMTDKICYEYCCAFLEHLKSINDFSEGKHVALAGDLRSSTPRILSALTHAVEDMGGIPIYLGKIPTPALVLYALTHNMPSIMVTGSHIPDDRNGLKFHTSEGEITKNDEEGIQAAITSAPAQMFDEYDMLIKPSPLPDINPDAASLYKQRFLDFFPDRFLSGKTIGVYEHSAVGRDIIKDILSALGARVLSLGRSKDFVAVDTEAIRPDDIELGLNWAKQNNLDCIISTDGDSDRPLVSDENGQWFRGDTAGLLTALYLNAECVVTPISSNTALEKSGVFSKTIRTRIGSPYVIAEMMGERQKNDMIVCGYEANGGFILASPIHHEGRELKSLPTRDSLIVPIAILALANNKNIPVSGLLEELPARYTYSDRIQNFPSEKSRSLLSAFEHGYDNPVGLSISNKFPELETPSCIETLDGVRMTYQNGDIIHIRPSGNAPELRCYTESNSNERAKNLNTHFLSLVKNL